MPFNPAHTVCAAAHTRVSMLWWPRVSSPNTSRDVNLGDAVDGVDMEEVDVEEADGEVGAVSDDLWMNPQQLLQKT